MQLATADVRSNFAETAFWSPAVVTEGGTAKVEVTFPDSLTQWHATARGLSPNVQVGAGESDVETKKNLLVRLQSPRFFIERDQVVLTANVHNYLKETKRVKVSLNAGDGLGIDNKPAADLATGEMMKSAEGWIEVKAGEEARVNWVVNVTQDGKADVQMTAQTDERCRRRENELPDFSSWRAAFRFAKRRPQRRPNSSRRHYQSAQRTALWRKAI